MEAFEPLVSALMNTPWSLFIRESSWGFPAVEALHVVAVVTVVGTIAIVDLRLIGLASNNCAVTEISRDTLRWTWLAFALAVLTGVGMFVAKVDEYVVLPSFWLKFACMAIAAINMAVFEFLTFRNVAQWDAGCQPPMAAKVAGTVSLTFWILVVIFGRWIGYTVGGGAIFGNGF